MRGFRDNVKESRRVIPRRDDEESAFCGLWFKADPSAKLGMTGCYARDDGVLHSGIAIRPSASLKAR